MEIAIILLEVLSFDVFHDNFIGHVPWPDEGEPDEGDVVPFIPLFFTVFTIPLILAARKGGR